MLLSTSHMTFAQPKALDEWRERLERELSELQSKSLPWRPETTPCCGQRNPPPAPLVEMSPSWWQRSVRSAAIESLEWRFSAEVRGGRIYGRAELHGDRDIPATDEVPEP